MVEPPPREHILHRPPREHILLCPYTYIGSIEKHEQTLWVWGEDEMVRRSISYVPGLYKIFDEILVNAADNKQRDPKMDSVKVTIDVEENLITVYNNGDGIPVMFNEKKGVYVPEILFGHVATSTNYDDSIKTTGGRNGFGAKLANIFSTEFTIETADGNKRYKQVFANNMGYKSKAYIRDCKSGENWTQVSFRPDLSKFGMKCLEADVVALMKRRVVDLAGCLGKSVKVELDGKHVPLTTFEDYVKLYLPSHEPLWIYEKVNERWEVCVSMAEGHFEQVSFLNNIATIKGGTHVNYIANQITKHLVAVFRKEENHANLKPHNVKKHLWLFVKAIIDDPEFDSQRKETLTIKQSSFGSKCELTPAFLEKVVKSDIVKKALSCKRKIPYIPELVEANFAATKNSGNCTLILTVGYSAKALAMSGLSVVGQDYYGVFPLKCKFLNVTRSPKQHQENVEFQHIMRILGFQRAKEHKNVEILRYGHLMIMADTDHKCSHIKTLLINFLHSYWPSLPKFPEFVLEFITPIAKATDKITNNVVKNFHTTPEYKEWKAFLGQKAMEFETKYYKERSGRAEYFADLDKIKRDFIWVDDMNKLFISADDEDGDAIEAAFSKKRIEARKTWLRALQAGTYFDSKEKHIPYPDFINKKLIRSSMTDYQSIPSMVDGLKPGQRKILFCAFKKPIVKEVNVFEFSRYVCEQTGYQYDEVNRVASTIIAMAQNFVGSNNINLLDSSVHFGTRIMGGKDHAHGSKLYTKLTPIASHLFHKADELVLNYLHEGGKPIGPTWYLPIIPMVLVNGSEEINTRLNTFVPNYKPRDIIDNVRRLLNHEAMKPMDPWYKGFNGTIKKISSGDTTRYISTGSIKIREDGISLNITELPVRMWTEGYSKFLMAASFSGEDKEPFIKDYSTQHTICTVDFKVKMTPDQMNKAIQEELHKKFKLTTNLNTSNMYLRDATGVIKKYETPEQILEDFFRLRMDYYEKRRTALLRELKEAISSLQRRLKLLEDLAGGKSPALEKELASKNDELAELQGLSSETLWLKDLDALEKQLDELDKIDADWEAMKKESQKKFIANLLGSPAAKGTGESKKTYLNVVLEGPGGDDIGHKIESSPDQFEGKLKRPEKARASGPGSPAVQGRGKAAAHNKAPAKSKGKTNLNAVQEGVGDDGIDVLENRFVGLNIESSPDQSEGFTLVRKKKQSAKRVAEAKASLQNKYMKTRQSELYWRRHKD